MSLWQGAGLGLYVTGRLQGNASVNIDITGTRNLLIAGFLAILLLMAGLGWLLSGVVGTLSGEIDAVGDHQHENMRYMAAFERIAYDRMIKLAEMVLTDDPFQRAELYDEYLALGGRFIALREAFLGRDDPEAAQLWRALQPDIRHDEQTNNRLVALLAQDRLAAARAFLNAHRLRAPARIRQLIDDMARRQDAADARILDVAHASRDFARQFIFWATGGMLLLGLVIAYVVTRGAQHAEVLLKRQKLAAEDMARRLRWQASHDPLTRLINRRDFRHHVDTACRVAREGGGESVLMYLDLDNFKAVNDSCGHQAGDHLLRQLTARMRSVLATGEVLARIGGDEFGVLLRNTGLKRGLEVAQALRRAVMDFRFFWQGRPFEVGVSIGLTAINRIQCNPHEVLSAVDSACFAAKDDGRNHIRVYGLDDEALMRRKLDLSWAQEIPRAIRDDRLVLFAQEIRDLRGGGRGTRYELLVRMRLEDGTLVEPGKFIPVAERFKLITELDRWVVRKALQWIGARNAVARLRAGGRAVAQGCRFSINLSGQTISDAGFLGEVLDLIERYHVQAEQVCFEITETAVVTNLDAARYFIDRLHGLGCRFALDDFGSGMSSFAYLQELDVDYLKIDGSLVRNMAHGRVANAMISAISHIAREMKIQTIAEFVEDDLTVNALRYSGVDYVQGFHLHRPEPLDSILPWHWYPERCQVPLLAV